MAVNGENIEVLAQPSVEGVGDTLLGFLRTAGNAYIEREIAPERTPPVNRSLNNTDTAAGEMQANINQALTPRNIVFGAAGILAVVAVTYAVVQGMK